MKIIRELLGTDLYKITLYCNNCGQFTNAYINKGTSVEDYLKQRNYLCSNCKCSSVAKARIQP